MEATRPFDCFVFPLHGKLGSFEVRARRISGGAKNEPVGLSCVPTTAGLTRSFLLLAWCCNQKWASPLLPGLCLHRLTQSTRILDIITRNSNVHYKYMDTARVDCGRRLSTWAELVRYPSIYLERVAHFVYDLSLSAAARQGEVVLCGDFV